MVEGEMTAGKKIKKKVEIYGKKLKREKGLKNASFCVINHTTFYEGGGSTFLQGTWTPPQERSSS